MASRRANEQAMVWLRSMAAEKDSLNGINAELCLRIIEEQKERLDKLGVQFHQVQNENRRLNEEPVNYIPAVREEKQTCGNCAFWNSNTHNNPEVKKCRTGCDRFYLLTDADWYCAGWKKHTDI